MPWFLYPRASPSDERPDPLSRSSRRGPTSGRKLTASATRLDPVLVSRWDPASAVIPRIERPGRFTYLYDHFGRLSQGVAIPVVGILLFVVVEWGFLVVQAPRISRP